MTMVPTVAGRLAFVGCICSANASIYLLYGSFPPMFASSAEKFGVAGSLICLGFLHAYRTSMKDREDVPDEALSSTAALSKKVLRFVKIAGTILGASAALCLLTAPWIGAIPWKIDPIQMMVVGSLFLVLREVASLLLAGKTFIKPEVHRVPINGGLFP